MSPIDQDQLTVDIARRFITQAAPQELPLFQGISEEFLENPDQILKQPRGKDALLGFGAAEAATLLTPIALTVANAVLSSLTQKTTETLWSRIGKAFKKLLKWPKARQQITLPSFTPEHLVMVREQARLKALSLKLPEPQARLLAEVIVGGLATASADRGHRRHP